MTLTLILIFLLLLSLSFNLYLFSNKKDKTVTKSLKASNTAESVGEFYNQQTDNFLKVYGEVIQAFRTTDINTLLDYQIEAIGFEDGWKVLDAGCGVCGPARYFASKKNISIDAVTISQDQVDKSNLYIDKEHLKEKVKVHLGDYHHLSKQFPQNTYNAVYFLESFGHAHNHLQVIDESWEILKPGGTLYIKDLFIKEGAFEGHQEAIQKEVENINKAYRYNIADLYQVIKHLRKKGFIVSTIKTIDLKLEEFENLTISNDFQELTGINKIENLKEYVFPVDFFEIKCYKPWNDIVFGNSRYFLQNLYYMQIEGKKQEEL